MAAAEEVSSVEADHLDQLLLHQDQLLDQLLDHKQDQLQLLHNKQPVEE